MQSRQKKVLPSYQRQNRAAAAIVLADPVRHLQWPGTLTEAEVEATLMVRWARRIIEKQVPVEELK